jgi:hypothetical protein
MKKYIFLILTLIGSIANVNAQFESGEPFISGSFNTHLFNSKVGDLDQTGFTYSFNLSVGKFVKDKKAVGWSLTNSLMLHKMNKPEYMKPLRSLGFGIRRFVEYYKPLGDKFAVYARPSAGIGYSLGKEYSGTGTVLLYETSSHEVSLSAGLEGGIAWRFSPKWAVYGSVAFADLINLSTSFDRKEYTNGLLDERRNAFDYNFSPTASFGQIGLGLRYFFGKK